MSRLANFDREQYESSDAEAIAAVLAGDADRFESLVRRYYPLMMRTAIARLGNRDWAEDAVQDALVAAFRGIRSYDSKYSFRTWLWAILINECRRKYKSEKSAVATRVMDRSTEEEAKSGAGSECWEQERLIAGEEIERAIGLLDQLEQHQSEAIKLRFFSELKYQEVAQLMGCSLATAKNRVRNGLQKLSRMLRSTEKTTKEL